MEKEEVVVVPGGLEGVDLGFEGWAGFQDFHANQTGEAAVHGVNGESGRAQAVDIVHGCDGGVSGEATERDAIGWGLAA